MLSGIVPAGAVTRSPASVGATGRANSAKSLRVTTTPPPPPARDGFFVRGYSSYARARGIGGSIANVFGMVTLGATVVGCYTIGEVS